MSESIRTRSWRWLFNFFPAYRGTGARVTYIAADWHEVRVEVPLSWRTRNYVGTIFGGSLYGAVDPIYMVMLIRLLGHDYVAWDKAASIRFRRPGRSTLSATFRVSEEELNAIRSALEEVDSIDRVYSVELVDREGVVHARVEKTIYVARNRGTARNRHGPIGPRRQRVGGAVREIARTSANLGRQIAHFCAMRLRYRARVPEMAGFDSRRLHQFSSAVFNCYGHISGRPCCGPASETACPRWRGGRVARWSGPRLVPRYLGH